MFPFSMSQVELPKTSSDSKLITLKKINKLFLENVYINVFTTVFSIFALQMILTASFLPSPFTIAFLLCL